jgi:hypothetical protein
MLSFLEKVQKLPFNVLADIAERAGGLTRTPMSVTGTSATWRHRETATASGLKAEAL